MCGICGLYGLQSADDPERTVRRMTQTLAHRGPDAAGIFLDAGVALGHRRLSIIELSDAGAQPMRFGATTIVYNGESYNFPQLRAELEALGHTFRGRSDTEVLLHAYDAWGLTGLERLEGIFAFALWDAARRRLVLMRDRLGIKPLFYARQGGRPRLVPRSRQFSPVSMPTARRIRRRSRNTCGTATPSKSGPFTRACGLCHPAAA
jgi:asparagine synthase (glutamine-hydrolysing)